MEGRVLCSRWICECLVPRKIQPQSYGYGGRCGEATPQKLLRFQIARGVKNRAARTVYASEVTKRGNFSYRDGMVEWTERRIPRAYCRRGERMYINLYLVLQQDPSNPSRTHDVTLGRQRVIDAICIEKVGLAVTRTDAL